MKKCPICDEGTIVGMSGKGRMVYYRGPSSVEIPADLILPACTECGEMFIDLESARLLDEALDKIYGDEKE